MSEHIKKLDQDQLKHFDREYVEPPMWPTVTARLGEFGDDFTLLDIGGGNGMFVDKVLDLFPRCRATLLDNAEPLLDANKPHPRKELVRASVEELRHVLGDHRFDVICYHWVLHHMVMPTYAATREMQTRVLREAKAFLSPRGRMSVFENIYQGRFVRPFAGWFIYRMTSSRLFAPFTKKLGANTAGVGVAFLDRARWLKTFRDAGLSVDKAQAYARWPLRRERRLFIKEVYVEHFWLRQ